MKYGRKVQLRPVRLLESAGTAELDAPAAGRITVAEAGYSPNMSPAGGRRRRARLIEGNRWGASGYYSAVVLGRDGPKIFPVGTQMFLDHPTPTEESERPVRSVKDLAATIVTTPVYEGDGLYADIETFPHAEPLIAALAETVALSIRADGMGRPGEVGGRRGMIIESLVAGHSVDFVTRGGAGGALISLRESAAVEVTEAANLGAWLEAALHTELTLHADRMYGNGQLTRDERIVLSKAIGEGLAAWTARVEADAPDLFTRPLDGEPESQTPAGQPLAEADTSTDNPGGTVPDESGTPTPAEPGTASGNTATSQIAALESQLGAVRTELAAQRTAMITAGAHSRITEALGVHATTPIGIRVRATVAGNLPLTEAGDLDQAALATRIGEAITAENAYAAQIAEANGAGRPRGIGAPVAPATAEQATTRLLEAFKASGMSDKAAALAAKGA